MADNCQLCAVELLEQLPHDKKWWRFWSKVDRSGECWHWRGFRSPTGYGLIYWKRNRRGYAQPLQTHRVAWLLTNGPIPEGQQVNHTCDTPKCVNPRHLYLGSQSENIADMHSRDRQNYSGPKLDEDRVRAIRREYESTGVTQATLAEKYGVTVHTIWSIVNRETWKHV